MCAKTDCQLPVWAHRVKKQQIARLYRSCGEGLMDTELIDAVGYALYARCKSMLQVTQAVHGRPPCPSCGSSARVRKGPTAFAECPSCGWACPWELYQKTYQRKGLFAGGMESFVKEFVDQFSSTRSHRQRLVLIDTLIHRFHWERGNHAAGRPGASSLIEGKMSDIMPFLDRLSYGDDAPPEVVRNREEWRRKWRENPWSSGRGQSSFCREADKDG